MRHVALLFGLILAGAIGLPAQGALDHPFQRVRERAIANLGRQLAAADAPLALIAERRASASPRCRGGALRALIAANRLDRADVRGAVRDFLQNETDQAARDGVLKELCGAILETGQARLADCLPAKDLGHALRRAARGQVRASLEGDLAGGARWTEFRVLGRYARLEPESAAVLEELAFDRDRPLPLRCLAVMALARMDAVGFWGGGPVEPRARFREAIDAADDETPASLKMAFFYGLAMRGLDTPARLQRAADFAIDDAFGSQLIESALYYLYSLPAASAERAQKELRRACVEFADSGYSDRELYGAAQLLRRAPTAETIRLGVAELGERDENFALYFWYCALLDCLDTLPEAERAPARRMLLDWGNDPARAVPQIRLAAFWYRKRDEGVKDPATVVDDALVAPVRASALAVHGEHADSDFYAQRSAGLLLGIFSSEENLPVLRRLLNHDSEAVRLAACLGANDDKHRALMPRLVEIAARDGDYAAYAAALTLSTLGHPRGREFLVDLVGGANRVLAPGALDALRRGHGGERAAGIPDRPSAWRARAALWRREAPTAPQPSR